MSNVEIERKFIVSDLDLLVLGSGVEIRQGYLSRDPEVRIRTTESSEHKVGILTIKGKGTIRRVEVNSPVTIEEATDLLLLCRDPPITKTRYVITYNAELSWEIDVYSGALSGLVVAEIELPAEDYPLEVPEWVGREVTYDPRYKNAALSLAAKPPQE